MTPTWATARLGDVLKTTTCNEPIDRSATYRLLGVRLDSGGPFLREEKAGTAISAKKLARVRAGEFIYSRLFAWRGAFGVIPPELDGCHVSGEFPTFAAVPERLDLNFLRYWFRLPGTLRAVEAWCSGSTPLTRNRLKEERFLALEVSLPPLTGQRRIVARIENFAGKLNQAGSMRSTSRFSARALLSSERHRTFSGLVAACRATTLGELITEAGYGTSVKCTEGRSQLSMPILRIPNVIAGALDLRGLKYAALSAGEQTKVRLMPDDLLVVRTNGSADLVGRCAVVGRLPEPMGFASYLIRLRCDTRLVDPEYLRTALADLRSSGALFDLARTTAGQYNVSLGRLCGSRFPLPPLPEQRRIVAYLDGLQAKVDALKTLQEKTGAELDALMPSILDKAFRGEL